jgi:hypothetical protein
MKCSEFSWAVHVCDAANVIVNNSNMSENVLYL